MEAVWKIEVEDFPAFMVVDDKGNDFFKKWSKTEAEAELDSFFDETKDFFYGLDKDSDGTLSVEEIAAGLMISKEEAAEIIKANDLDNDGTIDILEFELMLLKNAD